MRAARRFAGHHYYNYSLVFTLLSLCQICSLHLDKCTARNNFVEYAFEYVCYLRSVSYMSFHKAESRSSFCTSVSYRYRSSNSVSITLALINDSLRKTGFICIRAMNRVVVFYFPITFTKKFTFPTEILKRPSLIWLCRAESPHHSASSKVSSHLSLAHVSTTLNLKVRLPILASFVTTAMLGVPTLRFYYT